jgi:hypothetical protein
MKQSYQLRSAGACHLLVAAALSGLAGAAGHTDVASSALQGLASLVVAPIITHYSGLQPLKLRQQCQKLCIRRA